MSPTLFLAVMADAERRKADTSLVIETRASAARVADACHDVLAREGLTVADLREMAEQETRGSRVRSIEMPRLETSGVR